MAVAGNARRRAVITGAGGGMGRACARMLGETMDLVLTDVAAGPLDSFADALVQEGFAVAPLIAGDLSDAAVVEALAASAAEGAGLGTLVHTAGLSPALAPWEPIMRTNLIGTARLLAAIEPALRPGSVAILIASMAGHLAPALPEADPILDDPLAPDLIARIAPVIDALADHGDPRGSAQVSYALSKRATIRMAEQRAGDWARHGARIVSISPGTIWTPMGRREAEENPNAAAVVTATPAGRWGTAMDIAAAVRFLASDSAGFITGTDLRVDGGVTPYLRAARAMVRERKRA
jgi:NAD(P)-dependent dehydrogenase (short-subunit alcohol dehydrogenase family)